MDSLLIRDLRILCMLTRVCAAATSRIIPARWFSSGRCPLIQPSIPPPRVHTDAAAIGYSVAFFLPCLPDLNEGRIKCPRKEWREAQKQCRLPGSLLFDIPDHSTGSGTFRKPFPLRSPGLSRIRLKIPYQFLKVRRKEIQGVHGILPCHWF